MITEKEVLQTVTQNEIEICEYMETQANILISKLREFLNEENEVIPDVKKLIEETIAGKTKSAAQAEARKQMCEMIIKIFEKIED